MRVVLCNLTMAMDDSILGCTTRCMRAKAQRLVASLATAYPYKVGIRTVV